MAPWLGCLAAHGAVLRCFRTGLIMPGERGVTVILKMQDADGHWSTADQPAVSALVLVALQGQSIDAPEKEALKSGYEFLLKPAPAMHGARPTARH